MRTRVLLHACACLVVGLAGRLPAEPATDTVPGNKPSAQAKANRQIKLNFRDAELDTVLDHLSRTAGFSVVKKATIQGSVTAWSHEPLTPSEAVELLNTVLSTKGMAAVKSGKTLMIVSCEEAKTYDLPVLAGADPEGMERGESRVIQIIPVRYAKAKNMVENLSPFLTETASLTANETSNALILSDTKTRVRRIATIVKALDTSISAISEIKVFPLEQAEAKDLASVINEVFKTDTSSNNTGRSRMARMFMRMRGPGGDNQQNTQDSKAEQAATKVVAVGDENSNCLVVSAPSDMMDEITKLVKQVDVPTRETVSLRVFPLKYADAEEMADAVKELFSSTSSSNSSSSGNSGWGSSRRRGMPMGPPGMQGMSGGNNSSRSLQEADTSAVADTRTNSIVVTASEATLLLVEQMVKKLDADPANVAQVYVYKIKHADLEELKEILEGMFDDFDEVSSSNTTSAGRMTGAQMGGPTR